MGEIMTFFQVVAEMVSTVLFGGLTIGYGGLSLSAAIAGVFVSYAPYYIAFCLLVALTYYIIPIIKRLWK